ncbi:LLM class flavin-dependent oxidoreductase [Amycolatopsis acidicola]|uniref:LLM class flavin-dependent oxidoreductase n=1 Tax=Amycolatopsis acidicola TaxID=2596893 RepID=A0A5N0UVR2_9PSEU|nr:LLM class flavin-dependent oxidoreductase [Amycolatopsis acidicola]KAA9154177.1 LLM class flavin-dependent oxidoreductase [Amycolatopsis acidicola]
MTDRPFRFGIVGSAPDLPAWTTLARRAEEFGYDTLVSPDPQIDVDPFTILSAATAVTTRLKVGTWVAVDKFRDRRLLDWQARSLHRFTGGRFELGLGTGLPRAAARVESLGGTFGGTAERRAHLADTIEFLKREPGPPVLVAAGGPKMRALAAKQADIVTMAWLPRTTEDEARSIVDDFRRADERAAEVELALALFTVGDAPAPWLEEFMGVSPKQLLEEGAMTALPGKPQEAADRLRRWRAELGFSYFTINAGYLEQFAEVIALLRG